MCCAASIAAPQPDDSICFAVAMELLLLFLYVCVHTFDSVMVEAAPRDDGRPIRREEAPLPNRTYGVQGETVMTGIRDHTASSLADDSRYEVLHPWFCRHAPQWAPANAPAALTSSSSSSVSGDTTPPPAVLSLTALRTRATRYLSFLVEDSRPLEAHPPPLRCGEEG